VTDEQRVVLAIVLHKMVGAPGKKGWNYTQTKIADMLAEAVREYQFTLNRRQTGEEPHDQIT